MVTSEPHASGSPTRLGSPTAPRLAKSRQKDRQLDKCPPDASKSQWFNLSKSNLANDALRQMMRPQQTRTQQSRSARTGTRMPIHVLPSRCVPTSSAIAPNLIIQPAKSTQKHVMEVWSASRSLAYDASLLDVPRLVAKRLRIAWPAALSTLMGNTNNGNGRHADFSTNLRRTIYKGGLNHLWKLNHSLVTSSSTA